VQVLTSADGIWENVIKIKPPLVFSRQDADQFLCAANEVLPLLDAARSKLRDSDQDLRGRINLAQDAARAYFDRLLNAAVP
jgi:hypothetical protein